MPRVELKHIGMRPHNPFGGRLLMFQNALLLLFALDALLVLIQLCSRNLFLLEAAWPEGLMLLLAAASTLTSLSGQIPAQNAILGAVAIGGAGALAHIIGALTGIPFGPFVDNPPNFGRALFRTLPWPVPLIWAVVMLNSRGVGRLILRPQRRNARYGYWLMALTVSLVLVFELSLEPYATIVRQYWSWKATRLSTDWHSMPWSNLAGWAVTTTLILLFVTPTLISKSPRKPSPSYHPLIVWELLSLVMLAGLSLRHLWSAVVLVAGQMVLVGVFAILGSQARSSSVPAR